ncbi:sel1 repeat family protein [Dokdonella soli]|uniref:Sel1 repeat family protein n=1 Tax=Dokdonella soli TaxID=529810 RepID=A0ABN1ID58_9GAMM
MALRGLPSFCLLCTFSVSVAVAAADGSGDVAPRYDSKDNVNRLPSETWTTPEGDARPGQKYFFYAVNAISRHEYHFAIDMYQTAASWAYKPAEYNLAVMYLKGEGVPVDRPRAMAWMTLAAERGDKDYVAARELLYANLSADEFTQANAIWRDLKKTYGDEVAMPRAKARWAQVRAAMTGSHVGMPGNLQVGAAGSNVKPVDLTPSGKSVVDGFGTAAFGVLKGGQTDGTIAYRQLRESDNPYDPKFEWHTSPTPTGTATVGPVTPVAEKSAGGTPPADSSEPQHRNFF